MSAPQHIWLQDDGDYEAARPKNSEEEGITWSSDPIGESDTKYIRADLHEASLARLAKARVVMGTLLTNAGIWNHPGYPQVVEWLAESDA